MVNENDMNFARKMSARMVGEPTKSWLENPTEEMLDEKLTAMEAGVLECLTLYGPDEERFFVIGKPGFYSVTIFSDESQGYAYNDGTGDSSNIEIAGDYCPAFRVCKDMDVLKSVAHEFFKTGQPSNSEHWVHFSDDE